MAYVDILTVGVDAHAETHITGGTDVIDNAVAAGNAGLMNGTDKTKIDSAIIDGDTIDGGTFI